MLSAILIQPQIAEIPLIEEMGCVASRIDQDERVKVCRERKRLMRQLLLLREEFSSAQSDYLRALKNTGITLKQFTESESLEIENNPNILFLPPSPPPSLPPSPPPPPPPLSPDSGKASDNPKSEISPEGIIDIRENDGNTTPPPPVPSYSLGEWVFNTSMPHLLMKDESDDPGEQVEEENWEETKSEFESEEDDISDNSSTMNLCGKYASNMAVREWRGKKTLEDIIKELDDYFLKALAGEKDIAVFMDINTGDTSLHHSFAENKRKRSNSAKVFSALSRSWSSRSLQFTPDAVSSYEPCRPGAHSITLEKLYAAEQKLYKDIKEEKMTKLEHEKKSTLLKKQENENYNWIKAEKTRSCVENLECDIGRLQQSMSEHGSSILKLINEELYPQLVAIISGLAHMWRTMQECHQGQNHISQYLNHITDDKNIDMTTKNRRQVAVQLETQISFWYNSFCKLTKSQQDYVGTLCFWIRLTDHLGDNHQQSCCRSAVRRLCERWLMVFGKLPDKVTAEAIKSFLLAIQSVSQQQLEELRFHKKSDRLERRLQKELDLVADMERKLKLNPAVEDTPNLSNLSPRHPLLVKHAKIETLKKNVETEKAKFVNSVERTRAMTLNSLKTGLPKVFEALVAFASASAQAFEAIHGQIRQSSGCDSSVNGQIEQSSGCDSSEISAN